MLFYISNLITWRNVILSRYLSEVDLEFNCFKLPKTTSFITNRQKWTEFAICEWQFTNHQLNVSNKHIAIKKMKPPKHNLNICIYPTNEVSGLNSRHSNKGHYSKWKRHSDLPICFSYLYWGEHLSYCCYVIIVITVIIDIFFPVNEKFAGKKLC